MKQAIVLSLFLVVLAGVPALGDQGLLLSKQSKGFNFAPAFAVNPHNGDLLATWVRFVPNSSESEIWVSRAKRKANGKYKKKVKARKLSLSGVRPESNRKPRAAWIEENGEFFVVWEQKKFASNQTSIFGHAVTAAGVPKGELVSLTTDGKKNASPVVTASASGGIRVYHSGAAFTKNGTKQWKLKSLALSGEYGVDERATVSKAKKKVDEVEVVDVIDVSDQLFAATTSLARSGRTEDCKVVLTTEWEDIEFSARVPTTTLCLYHRGSKVHCLVYEGFEGITVDRFIGDVFFLAKDSITGDVVRYGVQAQDQCSFLARVTEGPPTSDSLYQSLLFPSDTFTLPGARWQSAQAGEFGYLLSSETDGLVYAQGFDEMLNPLGSKVALFDHGGSMREMIGGEVPVSSTTDNQPNSVLVWIKHQDNLKKQVRAHFFYLEPVE